MIKRFNKRNIKRQTKKIICILFAILFILFTPISSYFQIENNAYSLTLTFEQMIDSDYFTQIILATSIAAGIEFSKVEDTWGYTEEFKSYVKSLGKDYHIPDDPQGPKLEDTIRQILIGTTCVVLGSGIYKGLSVINDNFWKLVKSFVDQNYDVGENFSGFHVLPDGSEYFYLPNTSFEIYYYCYVNNQTRQYKISSVLTSTYNDIDTYKLRQKDDYFFNETISYTSANYSNRRLRIFSSDGSVRPEILTNDTWATSGGIRSVGYEVVSEKLEAGTKINGIPEYVDNPNRDFVNNQTKTREVVIPLETDPETGEPKKDETELPIPGIGPEAWVGVTPTEIPELDTSGDPYPAPVITPGTLPENPVLPENPTLEQIQDFTIIEYLKNLFNLNKNAANLENPTIMGVPAADGTGNGGTETPTKFDWGDFSHFLDIFFIFIYFIVILILILVKFLQVVFSNLPNIPPNTELFNDYPTILDGVNYIKNLKVGGLSITVQQAFEYVFLIFFFIFILKQIRKLYGAYVYEEQERDRNVHKDMKLDYYDNQHKYRDEDYNNIKFKGWH